MPTEPTAPEIEQRPPGRGPRRAGVVALALVGLALTAGITYAASTLVSQPIGLTSEPATVGDSLAPGAPVTTTSTPPQPGTSTVTRTVTVPQPVPVPVPVSPSDGDGDHSSGDGDGDGDDD